MNINNYSMLLAQGEAEVTPLQWAIFGGIMVVVVAYIIISGKKKSSSIPKKLMVKYAIKDSVIFGDCMLFVADDKIVVQSGLKWFEFKAADIKKVISSHQTGVKPVNTQLYVEFLDQNDKKIKGPKVFGGGVAVQSTKSFFIYSNSDSQKDKEQANKALKLIKDNFPEIEILVEM